MRCLNQELTFEVTKREFELRNIEFGPQQMRTLKLVDQDNLYSNASDRTTYKWPCWGGAQCRRRKSAGICPNTRFCYKKWGNQIAWSERVYRFQSSEKDGKEKSTKAEWKSKKYQLYYCKILQIKGKIGEADAVVIGVGAGFSTSAGFGRWQTHISMHFMCVWTGVKHMHRKKYGESQSAWMKISEQ